MRGRFRPEAGSGTLVELLRRRALDQSEVEGYIFLSESDGQAARLTYGELDQRARTIGAAMQALGLTGQRALLLYPPGLEFHAAFFGCLYAGAVAVPAYPPRAKRTLPRLRAIAGDAQVGVILGTSAVLSAVKPLLDQLPELSSVPRIDTTSLEPTLAGDWKESRVSAVSLAFLQYTSGSTGSPKGVMLAHGDLLHNASLIYSALNHNPQDKYVSWLPTYHDMGFMAGVLEPLYAGLCAVLLSPVSFLQSPFRWLKTISDYRGTTSGAPNFAYDLCVRKTTDEQRASIDLSSWVTAFNGAEPVRAETINRFCDAFNSCGFRRAVFYPCYGLAEATLIVSGGSRLSGPTIDAFDTEAMERNRVEDAEGSGARDLVACGEVLGEQEVVIVDPELETSCGSEQIGEIWVSGPSIARGYWNKPALSAQTFRARLQSRPNRTFLRTGDLGFIRDNQLFVTGRLKDLIIIRGLNHYPQDIELTVERSHSGLRPGCGAAFAIELSGEERLVVVHELDRTSGTSPDDVVACIRKEVAEEHELEVYAIALLDPGTIPKTSSGKIQRHACRASFLSSEFSSVYVSSSETSLSPVAGAEEMNVELFRTRSAKAGPAERLDLAEAFLSSFVARELRHAPMHIDPEAPLTSLGLDSLMAIDLQSMLERVLGIRISTSAVIAGATLKELATDVLVALETASAKSAGGGSVVKETSRTFPLSHGQRALWFLHQLAPESGAYNIGGAARIKTGADPRALRAALEKVVERHSSLRTTFPYLLGEPAQRIHESLPISFEIVEASGWSDRALKERVSEVVERPFELGVGPLIRAVFFARSSGDPVLALSLHHLVADLWSLAIIMKDLGVLYDGQVNGASAALPPVQTGYWAFVKAEAEMLASARGEELWRYWRAELSGRLRVLELPTDRPRSAIQTHSGRRVMGALTRPETEAVKNLAASSGATCFMTLISAFHVLLYRYSGAEDILVGTPAAVRETDEMAQVVGYLVNPIVIRVEARGDHPFSRFLTQVREKVALAYRHREYPFRLIVDRLQSERDPAHTPVFQVFFSFQRIQVRGLDQLAAFAVGNERTSVRLGGLELEAFGFERRAVQFDISLEVAEVDEKIVASLAYNDDFFDQHTAERLLGHYLETLRRVTRDPSQRLADISLLNKAEQHQILIEWNNVQGRLFLHEETTGVGHLLSLQAARFPDAIAVVSSASHLTYDRLERSSRKLANHIRRFGGRPELPVGLLVHRSENMLVCLLGALRSGAPYVPLDPAFPAARLHYMLADAGIQLLITDEQRSFTESGYSGQTVCLDRQLSAIDAESEWLEDEPLLDNLAYVIYTSGSTGKPKGVMVSHRNLVNFLLSMKECLCLSPADVLLATTTLSFDIAVLELLLPVIIGAKVVVASRDDVLDPNRLRDELDRHAVTVMQATPTTWRQLVGVPRTNGRLRVLSGGEPLPSQLADELLAWADELLNLYGPTETTVWSTLSSGMGAPPGSGSLSVGRPIHNTEIRVLGQFFEQLPIGARGLIYIGGEGVSRGYMSRADLTAERFRPDDYSSSPGSRIYDTGDIGRIAADGNIECLGRSDFQTKIRGHRIELGEIEAVLQSHPMVVDAVVTTGQVSSGENRLLAYVVGKDRNPPSAAMLRFHLKQKLPEYMLPAYYIALDRIPLTANGKVDRRALPGPGKDRPELESAFSAPSTPLEEALATIWGEVLGLEKIGVNDNFFELGGDSILAIKVVSRANHSNIRITPVNIFQQQTIAGLAGIVGNRLIQPLSRPSSIGVSQAFLKPFSESVRRDIETVLATRDELEDAYPLSAVQQGMLFHTLHSPGSGVYLEHLILTIESSLDRTAFKKAWDAIVGASTVLRTSIVWEGVSEPLQVVCRNVSLSYEEDDLSSLDSAVREDRLRSLIEEETQREFDLCQAPLMRLRLIRMGASSWQLVWTYHHILLDGWSLPILVNDVLRLYAAHVRGERMVLEPRRPYRDYVAWLANQDVSQAELFWREYLAGFNKPTTPALEARVMPGGNERAPFAELNAELSESSTASLLAATRRVHVTLNTILQGLWGLLLGRYSGEQDVLFGETYAGRPFSLEGAESMVGMFINTLPMRLQIEWEKPFGSWLKSLQERIAEVRQYEHSSLVQVQGWSGVAPGTPLFETILVMENYPVEKAVFSSWAGLRIESARLIEHTNYPLSIVIVPGQPILLRVIFDRSRYEEYSVLRFLEHFKGLLERASDLVERRLGEAPFLSIHEEHQILNEWNETRREFPRRALVHEIIQETAEESPDSIAVGFQSVQLSYSELNRISNLLASHLASIGVGPETSVGVLMERSEWMVAAILGVVKAGGAFLPIDPAYPASRISLVLKASGARFVIAQPQVSDLIIDQSITIITMDAEHPAFLLRDREGPLPAVNQDNLVYVIFTSGSTGEPKGVMITHGCLRNHMLWMSEAFPLKRDDVVLQKTSSSFDASVWEFFAPLMAGARLVMALPMAHWDAAEIVRAVQEEQVTTLQAVPSMLDLISEEPGFRASSSLRYLFSGGETLTLGLADRLSANTQASLYNLYGPSEATIDATSEHYDGCMRGTTVAIGRPIANIRVYILNEELALQPSGVSGSIWLGGAGIARGYLGAPDLTALKFRPNPAETEPGERLYHTGDLGKYLADGRVEFLGRADGQIKLHGLRIETGEVESVLEGHHAVRRAAVIAVGDNGQALRLRTYLVCKEGVAVGPEGLKQYLAERLPNSLIPTSFVFLDSLPLTANGKVDRNRLKTLKVQEPAQSVYQPPGNPVEQVLSDIWREVLGIQRVGRNDNFFELGGNSLLATQLASRVRRAFQVDLSVRMLFDARTVSEMARVLILNEARPGRTLELARLPSLNEVSSRLGLDLPKPSSWGLETAEPNHGAATARSPEDGYELNEVQKRIWHYVKNNLAGRARSIPLGLELLGKVHLTAVEDAIAYIALRHESLGSVFASVDGAPLRVTLSVPNPAVSIVDLIALRAEERPDVMYKLLVEDVTRGFKIDGDPSVRSCLIAASNQSSALAISLNEIVADRWSVGVLRREFEQAYESFSEGQPAELPELEVPTASWSRNQLEFGEQRDLMDLRRDWRQLLDGADVQLELSGANLSAEADVRTRAGENFEVPASLVKRVGELSDRLGTSMSMVFLAGWLTLLHRYTEQSDLVIGVTVPNRNAPGSKGLIGRFERTLAHRVSFAERPKVSDVLRRVCRAFDEALLYQSSPIGDVIDELRPGTDPSAPFQAQFYFVELQAESTLAVSACTRPIDLNVWTETSDVALWIAEGGRGWILYCLEMFDSVAVKRMAWHYLTLLERMVMGADETVSSLSFLTAGEAEQIIREWNSTVFPRERTPLLPELFEAVVDAGPDSVAILWGREHVSYKKLNCRANRLASYLRRHGVRADTVVGICLERSVDMVVALLAVIKAGGAYTPLDPEYPSDRLSSMLDQSRPPVVITNTSLIGRLGDQGLEGTIFLDLIGSDLEREADHSTTVEVCKENLAYVIFTSGSTGRPKGAMLTHEGISNCMMTTIEEFGIEPGNRVMQFASFSFDVSVWEIFSALLTGSTLCLFPGTAGFSDRHMLEFLRSEAISLAFPLSSVLASLPVEALPALRTLVTGGECFSNDLVDRWAPGRQFIYVYGPTEETILQSFVHCTEECPERPPTIGRPMRNLRFHVTDRNMEIVPVGVVGELCIGGVGTGRGYVNSPDLTAEKFVPDPFGEEPGTRLYKSGDLARLRSNGDLDFVGRSDGQIKIRGYRVELGEIESVVGRHPFVKQAVIVAREDRPGDKRLVGYVVPVNGAQPSTQGLRAFAKQALPHYMVPSAFVMLESLPFTPNGKVNRGALPPPGQDRPDLDVEYEPPVNPVQHVLTDIWAAVLGLEKVGIQDNFFELGGHSLLATQLVSRVRSTFQTDIPFRVLFESRNVDEMARVVIAHESKPGQAEAIAGIVKIVETMSAQDVDNALMLIKNTESYEQPT